MIIGIVISVDLLLLIELRSAVIGRFRLADLIIGAPLKASQDKQEADKIPTPTPPLQFMYPQPVPATGQVGVRPAMHPQQMQSYGQMQ